MNCPRFRKKPTDYLARGAQRWTPKGTINQIRPSTTWRRTVGAEMIERLQLERVGKESRK